MNRTYLSAASIVLAAAASASAGIIPGYGESTGTAASQYGTTDTGYTNPALAANGTSNTDWTAGPSDATGTESDTSGSYSWIGTSGATTFSTGASLWYYLDLDNIYSVSELAVWNGNQSNGYVNRGIETVNIYTGNTLEGLSLYASNQTISEAPASSSYSTPTVLNLGGINTRYVALQITSNYGATGYTEISHIQAYGNSTPVGSVYPSNSTNIPILSTSASSSYYPSSNLQNNSALVATSGRSYNAGYQVNTSGNIDADQWVASGTTASVKLYLANGSNIALGEMEIFNYWSSTNENRAADNVTVTVYDDDNNQVGSPITTNLLEADDDGTGILDRPQLLNLTGYTGEYVEIAINSNYGNSGYTGLAGVRFFTPTPEPASIALLAPGFLIMLRRRRQA